METLPYPPEPDTNWPVHLRQAYRKINDIYHTAAGYLASQSYDAHRLRFYILRIDQEVYPLLLTLQDAIPEHEIVLSGWLVQIAALLAELRNIMEETIEEHVDNEAGAEKNYWLPDVVTVEHTGRSGRPRKLVNEEVLRHALEQNISISKIARSLHMTRNTLKTRMSELGLESQRYSAIADHELDEIVSRFLKERPRAGRRYVMGHLKGEHNIRVPQRRVIASLSRVNKVGNELKKQETAQTLRPDYIVDRPHSLWHIDGHHKLITWGIVIHGIVDGYSRKVTGLRASTSNSSKVVAALFIDAIQAHGIPSRVRGDRGGENKDVSILMILLRGVKRGSFSWGKSTSNTRIERMWGNIGAFFARDWRAFFLRLERRHLLDRRNRSHIWLLHYLFLDQINDDCDTFVMTWNNHPIGGKGKDMTPNQIEFDGMLAHGIYQSPESRPGFNFDELKAYYEQLFGSDSDSDGSEFESDSDDDGIDSEYSEDDGNDSDSDLSSTDEQDSQQGDDSMMEDVNESSGPSDSETEDDATSSASPHLNYSLEEEARSSADANIANPPIHVRKSACPFDRNEMETFEHELQGRIARGKLPHGYGVRPSELGPRGYESSESIPLGRRGRTVTLELENEIWRPRAEEWCQALHVMDRMLNNM
ncbi:hypothetical protein CVT26_001058 [Gymnopilus dilepis]|uniref:Integrase catalytic domain-containing protein n=1 Tax=Gymnopilus dilepis TaxID=231916 RepID=A0A409WL86_9AGAR|nr:hypothetical protein CVT26_001058 [Gymnopilus dilepis]